MSHSEFIQSITSELSQKIRGYAGGMLVDVVYNYQGSAIGVIWSHAKTGDTEVYSFPIVDSETYTENVNNGQDYTSYRSGFINMVFQKMVEVESIQTGRPAAF